VAQKQRSGRLAAALRLALYPAFEPVERTRLQTLTMNAQNARNSKNYAEAEKLYLTAIQEAQKSSDLVTHLHLAQHGLAQVYKEQGRYGEAEKIHWTLLRNAQDSPQPTTLVHAGHVSLAQLYEDQQKFGEAEPHYKAALAETEKLELWPNRAPLVSTSILVAKFYVSQRRYTEAEPQFRRALEILESQESRADSYLPRHLADFAKFYQDQGKNEAAEEFYLRALALSEKTRGPESTLTVHARNELAGFYRATLRYVEAETNYRRVLAIMEKTATAQTSLYTKYTKTWRRLRWNRRAVQALIGGPQLSVGAALDRLAEVYEDQQKYAEAEPLRKRSLDIKEKARGETLHTTVADALETYAAVLSKMGRVTEAVDLEARARSIWAKYPKESCRYELRCFTKPMRRTLWWRLSTFVNAIFHPSRFHTGQEH
jgi:tetratricopeptide (TPR) repeat protein